MDGLGAAVPHPEPSGSCERRSSGTARVAAIKNGLTNARMEAMNNKIKVINHRAYGFRNMDNLIARSELCCSGLRPGWQAKGVIYDHTC